MLSAGSTGNAFNRKFSDDNAKAGRFPKSGLFVKPSIKEVANIPVQSVMLVKPQAPMSHLYGPERMLLRMLIYIYFSYKK